MEKATTPWEGNEVILSSDSDDSSPSSDSDTEIKDVSLEIRATNSNNVVVKSAKEHTLEEIVARRAKMYQDYMKCIPIPKQHESVIPFDTWGGLANSMKQLYKQPLHYLTNVLLKQWDRARMYTDNEDVPLEDIFHPRKAEDTIWQIEEVHRLNTSHYHLTKLWLADPMHHAHVDSIMAKPSV